MNPVLVEILTSGSVTDGYQTLPLHSSMSPEEGELINRVYQKVKPNTSLEVGMAYGVSTLFIGDALTANGKTARHIVIDPFQRTQWRGIGLRNVQRAGFGSLVELHEAKSELELPTLLSNGTEIQVAVIDGWHTFDHTLVDFFYINKMLAVGGIIILDDTNMPAVKRVADHILSYPAYRLYASVMGPTKRIGFRTR
ncbi:MAG: class I SAM-dependent methyltransferase, partial [Acidobacteria bacterium]|nr:class I SAM-dependent methyltransferase [Acidobacteriota bacterium]